MFTFFKILFEQIKVLIVLFVFSVQIFAQEQAIGNQYWHLFRKQKDLTFRSTQFFH
jgi:hypothetical protein